MPKRFFKWRERKKEQKDSYNFGIIFEGVVLFGGPRSPDDIQFYLDTIAQRWRDGWRPISLAPTPHITLQEYIQRKREA
jgi:hypothetical protein